MVSTRGALSQPSGWVVPAGAPSGPSAMTLTVLPWSSRRALKILALPLLCPPPYFRFIRPHHNWRRWRKEVWEDASTRWVSGCTSLPTHCHRLEGEGQSPVQVMQDHFSTRWTLLRFSWTGGFGAPHYGGSTGLSGQAPLCHRRVWAWSCDSQGAEKCNRPGFGSQTTAQAIGRSMAGLVVLERHLWLTLTEIKDADKVSFLDAPISPSGLFGPAVKGFAERFTEAQKASQVMRHFLPSAPAQQLLRVALRLRRLSSPRSLHLPFPPLSLPRLSRREGIHAQPDATPFRSVRAPDPR